MPETRSTFDASQYLQKMDQDIVSEYNSIIDAAVTAKEKYAKMMTLVQRMQQALALKQGELEQHVSHHQRDLSYHKTCADTARDKLRATSARLHKYKAENDSLRRRNKHLAEDLKTVNAKLEQAQHLRCDICMDSLKNTVTRCGHGYCADCLETWLRQPNDDTDATDEDSDTDDRPKRSVGHCPTCRRDVNAVRDVWPIYLENANPASENVCVDIDSD